jgi:hypothetical protein
MGTAVRWDAFADVDAFVDEVLAELTVMAGRHPAAALGAQAVAGRSGAARGGDGDLLRLLLRRNAEWRVLAHAS